MCSKQPVSANRLCVINFMEFIGYSYARDETEIGKGK